MTASRFRDEVQELEDAEQVILDLGGVDYISSGALTHSAGILDMSMKNLQVLD